MSPSPKATSINSQFIPIVLSGYETAASLYSYNSDPAEVKKNGPALKVRDEKGVPLFRGQGPDGQETKGRGRGGMGSGGRGRGSW